MFFKIVRFVLGNLILLGDALTRPRPMKREATEQQQINEQVQKLSLYQFRACPFCVKTRRAIRRLNLPIETVDAKQPDNKQRLVEQGGSPKVPCLRIEQEDGVKWLYESSDIIDYLQTQYT